jgi:hypothetical protein
VPPETPFLEGIRKILPACCAHVRGTGGKAQGSGFFIDEELLLTCAHVVVGNEKDQVDVEPIGRPSRKGTILKVLGEKTVDLALVEVKRLDGEEPQDAAVIDGALDDNIDYYAVGFPVEPMAGSSAGYQEIAYKGNAHITGSTPALLILQAGGALVSPGMSGGAVLNARSGAVAAIVQYRQDRQIPSGGGAIPIARASELLPEVRECLDKPPVATKRWRDELGEDAWRALGKSWGWRDELNIRIEGTPSCWKIGVNGATPLSLTGAGLPENVSEALFHWAQRRRVRRREDVRLLGRLLAAALFPDSVLARVKRGANNDQMLVRLWFEGESVLFDVPWEFASVEIGGKDRHLAVDPQMGLVRVGAHPNEDKVQIAAMADNGAVLGIVVQPEMWAPYMPKLLTSGPPEEWPSLKKLKEKLGEAIDKAGKRVVESQEVPRLRALLQENPTAPEVKHALATASFDIVHYVGFGHVDHGTPSIAFVDDDGMLVWRDVNEVFGWVADADARLLVVELLLPSMVAELEPIPPRAFLSALSDRINAVVYTRLPVHPKLSNSFNNAFYYALGEGRSVEAAMQYARRALHDGQVAGDAASFGWFSLLTGPKADTQLLKTGVGVQAEARSSVPHGPSQPSRRDGFG